MTGRPAYTIDSISEDGAIRNLNSLIAVICELKFDSSGNDDDEMRIDHLLWIARDLSDGIIAFHDAEVAKNLADLKGRKAGAA